MTTPVARQTRPLLMVGLIAAQALCAAVLLASSIAEWLESGRAAVGWDLGVEVSATLGLIVAVALESAQLRRMLLREAHMARSLSAAGRALHEIMEAHFAEWRLTPSEQDVATFLVKGSDIAEIARLRGSAEGTVKAHLNAIYRKAGVTGRPGLLSLLIEDLVGEPLIAARPAAAPPPRPPGDPVPGVASPLDRTEPSL